MRLNLGCGRAQLPTTPDNPFTQHLHGLPQTGYTKDDWVNVDAADIEGIDQVVNLFQYPWPWKDNSVTEIWCSHLIEHIPHVADVLPSIDRENPGSLGICARLNGWYAFFHEVHRVLKPDGEIHIITPHGHSVQAITDPTHTRQILPGTFGYFKPNPDAPFDYGLPYEFAATNEATVRPTTLAIRDTMMAIRTEDDPVKRDELAKGFWTDALHSINWFNEIGITLRAVK